MSANNWNLAINVHVKTQKCSDSYYNIQIVLAVVEISLVFSNNYAKNYTSSIYQSLADCSCNIVQGVSCFTESEYGKVMRRGVHRGMKAIFSRSGPCTWCIL